VVDGGHRGGGGVRRRAGAVVRPRPPPAASGRDRRAALARELREALHPLGAADPAWLERVRSVVVSAGCSEADLLAPPPPAGAASRHCPRCHQRFAAAVATCSECAGIALRNG